MQRYVVAAGVLLLIMFAGQCGQSNGHRERDSPPPAASEVEVRMAETHQQAVAQWSRERAHSASLEGEVANGRGTVGVLSITVVVLASALTVTLSALLIRRGRGQ
jgi:hypothetical protein